MLSVFQKETVDEIKNGEEEIQSGTFEETLNEYLYQQPKQGQIIEGEIETIDEDGIILNVGMKRAAIVPGREVDSLDDEIIEELSVGDVIPIRVTQAPIGDQDLLVSIDAALEVQSWQKAKEYMENDRLLELEVTGSNRGGILVSFDKIEGFVPNSHIPDLRNVHDFDRVNQKKQKMKGSDIKVKVIEVDPEKERLILSAQQAGKAEREQRLQELEVWDVVTGKVVNVVDFGIFVNLGGIDGLVHTSELDWVNVPHPSKMFDVGDEIEVQVIGIDIERERVQLSRKTLQPNPWDEVEVNYVPGNLVEVEITSVVDFGAFGKLPEGVQGLIHQSELGYTAPGYEDSLVESGQRVLVKILSINAERERIAMSMQKVPLEKQIDWMMEAFEQDEENGEVDQSIPEDQD